MSDKDLMTFVVLIDSYGSSIRWVPWRNRWATVLDVDLRLRLLRYFVAVIDHGGVTRAAEALYVAQPSVSQSLRTLEKHLGITLFVRVGRQLELTAAGHELEHHARMVLAEVEEAEREVARVARAETGRISLSSVSTLAIDPLGPWVRRLLDNHPDLQIHVSEPGSVPAVLAELRDGTAEIGLVELPVYEASLKTIEVAGQEVMLACGPRTAAMLPDPVPRELLPNLTMGVLIRHEGGTTESERTAHSLAGRRQVRCEQRQLLWDLVQQDVAVTWVAQGAGELLLPSAVLRSVDPPLHRRIGLVYRPGPLSPGAMALLSIAIRRLRPER